MWTGYTPIGTAPKRETHTLQNTQNNQFKSMLNAIHEWEGTGFPRAEKMEEVRHHKPQFVPCLHSAWISYPKSGMMKDSTH